MASSASRRAFMPLGTEELRGRAEDDIWRWIEESSPAQSLFLLSVMGTRPQ